MNNNIAAIIQQQSGQCVHRPQSGSYQGGGSYDNAVQLNQLMTNLGVDSGLATTGSGGSSQISTDQLINQLVETADVVPTEDLCDNSVKLQSHYLGFIEDLWKERPGSQKNPRDNAYGCLAMMWIATCSGGVVLPAAGAVGGLGVGLGVGFLVGFLIGGSAGTGGGAGVGAAGAGVGAIPGAIIGLLGGGVSAGLLGGLIGCLSGAAIGFAVGGIATLILLLVAAIITIPIVGYIEEKFPYQSQPTLP